MNTDTKRASNEEIIKQHISHMDSAFEEYSVRPMFKWL